MKKLTDYNFKVLSVGKRYFLNDCINESEKNPSFDLGKVVLVDFNYNAKVVNVGNVFELYNLYCDFLKCEYVDFLPLGISLNIKRLLDIFQDLGVSVGE